MKGRILWLWIGLLLPSGAVGQTLEDYDYENLQFRGLGLDFGWVIPSGIEPAPSFGIRADMGFVGPRVRIAPALRFWSSRMHEREVQRLADQIVQICQRQSASACPASLNLGEVRRSDLELSVDGFYQLETPLILSPYLGGGTSLHLLNGRGAFIDETFVEDLLDTVVPGVSLLAGLHLPLGSLLQLLGEARFVLTSDVRYAGFSLSGVFTLPSPPRNPLAATPRGGTR